MQPQFLRLECSLGRGQAAQAFACGIVLVAQCVDTQCRVGRRAGEFGQQGLLVRRFGR
jgi:hypothetical protein